MFSIQQAILHLFDFGRARLGALASGAGNVVVGNPLLVVLAAGNSGGGLGAGEGGVDFNPLGLLGRARGLLGGGEEGLDPGLVDKVESTGECGGEDEVQENARKQVSDSCEYRRAQLYSHLRVEEASRGFHNGRGAIVGRDGEDATLGVGDNGHELDADVLGLHVERKGIGHLLRLAGGDGQVVLRGRQVVQDALVERRVVGQRLLRRQGARDKGDLDGAVLVVGHLDDGARGLAVDQAQADELGVGKRGRDLGIELRGGGGSFRLGLLF